MRPYRASVESPLLRRLFGNERRREIKEVENLYDWVRRCHAVVSDTPGAVLAKVQFYYDCVPDEVLTPIIRAARDIINAHDHLWELPPPDFHQMNMGEFMRYREFLQRKQRYFLNRDEVIRLLYEGIIRTTYALVEELPLISDPSPFTIPLAYTLADPYRTVALFYAVCDADEFKNHYLFTDLVERLYQNLCAISGRNPDDQNSSKPFIAPDDSGLAIQPMVKAYLGGTPYRAILEAPVALKLTREDRFTHMHIVGGSGAGKTTLIETLIRYDLSTDDPPSVVLVDPHSDLTRKLVHSDLGAKRVILIDPRDTQFPIAINPFAINRERFATYDERLREQVTAGVIQTFDYLFSTLFALSLTGKQQTFFRYVTRLLLTLPEVKERNATIIDILNLIKNPAEYQEAIDLLPPIPRDFFNEDFKSKTFDQTREQIRYRIQAIIENPTLARLLTATETKIDLFTEMNRGSVILIDTAKDFLKDSSPVFGKLMVSLVLQAILERAAMEEGDRHDTFLYIDEAGSFFSTNIDDLLTDARKYKCGIVLAHQYLDQATGSLKSSLHANTGIKFASGLSAGDARSLGPELRTTPEFIIKQPKLQFACHIRGVTPTAVAIPVKPIIDYDRLSDEQFEAFVDENRQRVSLGQLQAPVQPDARVEEASYYEELEEGHNEI